MPCLVTPDSRHLRSFVAALREGFDRDTLRPETAETVAEVDHTWRPGETALQYWIDIPDKT